MKTFFIQKYAQQNGGEHVDAKGGKSEPDGQAKNGKSERGTEEKIYEIPHPSCMKRAIDAGKEIVEKAPRRTDEEHE